VTAAVLEHDRGAQLGLRDDELAFYEALLQNDSAVTEKGDDMLKAIAKELVATVRHQCGFGQEGTGPSAAAWPDPSPLGEIPLPAGRLGGGHSTGYGPGRAARGTDRSVLADR